MLAQASPLLSKYCKNFSKPIKRMSKSYKCDREKCIVVHIGVTRKTIKWLWHPFKDSISR